MLFDLNRMGHWTLLVLCDYFINRFYAMHTQIIWKLSLEI